LINYQILIL